MIFNYPFLPLVSINMQAIIFLGNRSGKIILELTLSHIRNNTHVLGIIPYTLDGRQSKKLIHVLSTKVDQI